MAVSLSNGTVLAQNAVDFVLCQGYRRDGRVASSLARELFGETEAADGARVSIWGGQFTADAGKRLIFVGRIWYFTSEPDGHVYVV